MLRRIRELSSDALIYGASSMLAQMAGFLLLPLYTAYLTPYDYGVLAMLAIVTALFLPIFGAGLPPGVFRFTSRAKSKRSRRRIVSTAFWAVLGSATAGLVLLLAISPWFSAILVDDAPVLYLAVTLISAWLTCLSEIPLVIFRLERKVIRVAAVSFVSLFATTLVTIFLVVFREIGVIGCVWGLFAGAVVQFGSCMCLTYRSIDLRLRARQLKILVNYGIWFVPHQVQALGLAYLAQFLVKSWVSIEAAGLYNVALKFVLPFYLIVNSVQKAWKPIKFQIHSSDSDPPKVFRGIMSLYVAATTTIYFITAVVGPSFLEWYISPNLAAASGLVPFIALIPLAHGLYFMLATGIEFSTRPKAMPLVASLGLAALMLASPLIGEFGATGAAVATAFAWLTMGIFIYFLARRVFAISYDWILVSSLLAFSIFAAICLSGAGFGLVPLGAISLAYLCLMWVFVAVRVRSAASLFRAP